MDESFLNSLDKQDERYVVTVKYPHCLPVLKLCNNAETRKKMWIKAITKATSTNSTILPKIVSLRQQIAVLLGFDSDTSLCLSNKQRMVESTEQLNEFLDRTGDVLKTKTQDEMTSFRKIKGSEDIYPWDTMYLNDKRMKNEFNVDHQLIKTYFPLEHGYLLI